MIDPHIVKELLTYNPDSGELFWLPRDISWFRDGIKHSARHCCRHWNTRYAGKQALTSKNGDGYFTGCILSKSVKAHRVAWCITHGYWPENDLDHINGIRSDNRLINLRSVSRAENNRNHALHIVNRSGFNGVSKSGSRWAARINAHGHERRLGTFDTKAEAIEARARADRIFGFHPNHGREQVLCADSEKGVSFKHHGRR